MTPKDKRKIYNNKPEVILKRKNYIKTLKYKLYRREYGKKDYVKTRRNYLNKRRGYAIRSLINLHRDEYINYLYDFENLNLNIKTENFNYNTDNLILHTPLITDYNYLQDYNNSEINYYNPDSEDLQKYNNIINTEDLNYLFTDE